jgi:putative transposase
MSYDPNKHHRRSIRLPSWDYRWPGTYFVTVCTHRRTPLFGDVVDGRMRVSAFGRVVVEEWYRTEQMRANVALDAFVVMPDHIHGIVIITEASTDARRVTARRDPTRSNRQFGHPQPGSLPTIVGAFKSAATKRINRMRGTPGAPVWQRNYWERIVRDEDEMNAIRQYITDNPARWHHDRSHPAAGAYTG